MSTPRRAESAVFDALRWRKDFPILGEKVHGKPLVYLDNAATSQKPYQAIISYLLAYAITHY